jgi:hypothetical protein
VADVWRNHEERWPVLEVGCRLAANPIADMIEAIGMRVLRIAEEMSTGSRHQGHSERLIEQAEQAAIDLHAAVRGRGPRRVIKP